MDAQNDRISEDLLFNGALRLLQPKAGHRAGTDAVLLAACLPKGVTRIADLGAASGVVGLRTAQMESEARVTLIERDTDLVALAQRNIGLNRLETRAAAIAADAFKLGGDNRFREVFDCVLTNPPFYQASAARASPNPGRAAAHLFAGDETLDRWLRAATAILAPKGRLIMVHSADHLPEILACMAGRLGGLVLRFVHPRADQPANRVLVAGRKGSRARLCVLPPLILGAEDGFTPETEAIHRGEKRIEMIE